VGTQNDFVDFEVVALAYDGEVRVLTRKHHLKRRTLRVSVVFFSERRSPETRRHCHVVVSRVLKVDLAVIRDTRSGYHMDLEEGRGIYCDQLLSSYEEVVAFAVRSSRSCFIMCQSCMFHEWLEGASSTRRHLAVDASEEFNTIGK